MKIFILDWLLSKSSTTNKKLRLPIKSPFVSLFLIGYAEFKFWLVILFIVF